MIPPNEIPAGAGRGPGGRGGPAFRLVVTDVAAGLKAGDRIAGVDGAAANTLPS
ncbi:MAG TPA: hypothetical protein VMB03_29900 [Bryobacteraceae bacterium]|nr:hypothetical protein [Bryobacteraceae bacterium]